VTAQTLGETSRFASAQWRALGTYVQLVVTPASRLAEARALAVRLLDDVDRTCSRFRDDSDLMRANRRPGEWTRVDPLLAAAVRAALDAADATDGLVDPTLGLSMAAIGYDRDFEALRLGDGPTAIPRPAVIDGWRWVQTDPEGAVLVPHGTALDLGATGKAFAADLIAGAVARGLDARCALSLGGDVAIGDVVLGDAGPGETGLGDAGPGDAADDERVPWQVAISETPDEPASVVVTLPSGGLATSTVMARRWHRGGRVVHHLLDPSSGRPVDPVWRTASVTAATCLAANTASTATVILGAAAADWLSQRALGARLVGSGGEILHVGEWLEEAG
jgi:thiamine biosynthesis lipoprotein